MSLLISLFGIAKSLFLSIHERIRELACCVRSGRPAVRFASSSATRACHRRPARHRDRRVFAWMTTYALEEFGLRFVVPAGQLVVFGLLAIAVGLLAARVPARRAARLDILRAVGQASRRSPRCSS